MDAQLYLKTKEKMTKDCTACDECPFNIDNNKFNLTCDRFEFYHSKRAIKIVEDWLKEHPERTMMQDFFEKFPNAQKNDDGTPLCCPSYCGYTKEDSCRDFSGDCFLCWSRPLEESK